MSSQGNKQLDRKKYGQSVLLAGVVLTIVGAVGFVIAPGPNFFFTLIVVGVSFIFLGWLTIK